MSRGSNEAQPILKCSKVLEYWMKIAMVLAISVIFTSGIYTAYAEEPIPTLNFEGGDYTVYKGNPILKSVIVQVENHDHKVHPKIQGHLIEAITGIVKGTSNNRVIIETHSEHFILRLQKLLREKKIEKDLISINYVYLDEKGEGSKIDNMILDENGKFINKWRHINIVDN